MINGVKIIRAETAWEFQSEIDKCIKNRVVKDIKFCVNPVIKGSYGSSYSSGSDYYAMVIFDER